jgi:hypothetical protein
LSLNRRGGCCTSFRICRPGAAPFVKRSGLSVGVRDEADKERCGAQMITITQSAGAYRGRAIRRSVRAIRICTSSLAAPRCLVLPLAAPRCLSLRLLSRAASRCPSLPLAASRSFSLPLAASRCAYCLSLPLASPCCLSLPLAASRCAYCHSLPLAALPCSVLVQLTARAAASVETKAPCTVRAAGFKRARYFPTRVEVALGGK